MILAVYKKKRTGAGVSWLSHDAPEEDRGLQSRHNSSDVGGRIKNRLLASYDIWL